ncbi:class I SAM-dependent methyltransferase [Pseudanabaena sp. Chao 1811]|uniref:class I SAM-dependent methyltransferase n=1 Tax=Pseudanabaena sp. Chao 1811 TaxID=2963092 RepID=UPI0022F3C60C|nr:class I SAM-dependent methyltransferase [Pseudanabaena sp. Chao 1811]
MNTNPNEKIRQQFDLMPYPNLPASQMGGDGDRGLILHSFVTAWYAKTQRVCDRQDLTILDIGCGSGVTTLALAMANPKARIVGIDLSEASLKLASDRLTYHGFPNAEFYNLPIAELPRFKEEQGIEFDYINCEDTLYFLPSPAEGLQAMRSVLKSEGLLRTNVHSLYQRADFFRAQTFAKLLGFLDGNPTETEYRQIYTIMEALGDGTMLKASTWTPSDKSFGFVLMNYVMQEDKGFTIPDVFQMLRSANLEFVSMINPADWRWQNIFPNGMPEQFTQFLAKATAEQNLHAFELLQPVNRLLDIWCGHSGRSPEYVEISQWSEGMWNSAMMHLHPVLRTSQFFQTLDQAIAQMRPNPNLQKLHRPHLDALTVTLCLRFLWQRPCKFAEIVTYWCSHKPRLEAYRQVSTIIGGSVAPVGKLSDRQAQDELKFLLNELVLDHLVLIELPS